MSIIASTLQKKQFTILKTKESIRNDVRAIPEQMPESCDNKLDFIIFKFLQR